MCTARPHPLWLLACLSIHLSLSISCQEFITDVDPAFLRVASTSLHQSKTSVGHASMFTRFAPEDMRVAFVWTYAWTSLLEIKQPCLQLTNCSFKKAQSGSENAPPLPSVPAAASVSRQADFSFPESLFADAGSAETDSFSVWQGDFGSFLLR